MQATLCQVAEQQTQRGPHDHLHADGSNAEFPEQHGRKAAGTSLIAGMPICTAAMITTNTAAPAMDAFHDPMRAIAARRTFSENTMVASEITIIKKNRPVR